MNTTLAELANNAVMLLQVLSVVVGAVFIAFVLLFFISYAAKLMWDFFRETRHDRRIQ